MIMGLIEERIKESIAVKEAILCDGVLMGRIQDAADIIAESLGRGGKILFCGNGGSASDALHLAAEFVGRFQKERVSLPAIALNADVAAMTAIANDYGYDRIFARAVEGLMKPGDVLVGVSTSGNSENVYQGILEARKAGGRTVALLGRDGGKIKGAADIPITVPGRCTARIQEAHIMIGHILFEIAEGQMQA